MRDYNYIDDVEVLKDNILEEDCKIIRRNETPCGNRTGIVE